MKNRIRRFRRLAQIRSQRGAEFCFPDSAALVWCSGEEPRSHKTTPDGRPERHGRGLRRLPATPGSGWIAWASTRRARDHDADRLLYPEPRREVPDSLQQAGRHFLTARNKQPFAQGLFRSRTGATPARRGSRCASSTRSAGPDFAPAPLRSLPVHVL